MLTSRLTPEASLLFRCASGATADEGIRRLLAGGVDWGQLTMLADREKAAPVLWERIRRVAPERARSPEAAPLQRLARIVQFKMEYLAQRVAESTAALESAGIGFTLLKGAALAAGVYGSFVQRPMIDVDLLVAPDDAREALGVLLEAGWAWQSGKPRDGDFAHLHHLPALMDARGMEVSLELHTALLPPGGPFELSGRAMLDSASLRKSRVAQRFASSHVPAPHYLLVHTAIHLAWSHLFRQGLWRSVRDVDALVQRADLDWEALVQLAQTARAGSCCYWTLRLASSLCGVAVPADVLARLRPRLPEPALAVLERHLALIALPTQVSCPSIRLRRLMWSAAIQPRLSGHGAVRPWTLLEVLPEDRARKARLAESSALPSEGGWMDYWRSILVSAAPSR
ncbi:MAG: nucleotidyltransferase family protein [Gemmatimonadaceae bacterium]|nr:nucleotidyltransferase family protein [Gemmatimonadaceae bacterium]NUR20303.1 nucleotidyltransferase family protein [Gemmatimonadaceae bacterium]